MPVKILLADDNLTAQNMARKILADAGYEVVAVSNGAAALKKFAEQRFDLAVLDVYMPGYTGLEVCQKIKMQSVTPVLLSVGKLDPYRPEDGQRVRADGMVVKPFEATDLVGAAERLAPLGNEKKSRKEKIQESSSARLELLSPLAAEAAAASVKEESSFLPGPEPMAVLAPFPAQQGSVPVAVHSATQETAIQGTETEATKLSNTIEAEVPHEPEHGCFGLATVTDLPGFNEPEPIEPETRWLAILEPDEEEQLSVLGPTADSHAPTARDLLERELIAEDEDHDGRAPEDAPLAEELSAEPEQHVPAQLEAPAPALIPALVEDPIHVEASTSTQEADTEGDDDGASGWIVPGVVPSDNWAGVAASHADETPVPPVPAEFRSNGSAASNAGDDSPVNPRQLLQIISTSTLHEDLNPSSNEIAEAFDRVLARNRDRLIEEVVRELESKNGKA